LEKGELQQRLILIKKKKKKLFKPPRQMMESLSNHLVQPLLKLSGSYVMVLGCTLLIIAIATIRCRNSNTKNLNCFGCGCSYENAALRWTCKNCLFDNDLDLDGFQKDVIRFAQRSGKFCVQPLNNGIKPPSIFCKVCISNQAIVLEILKGYSRDFGDLAAHRISLENRYPPVCQICLPKGF
jgi:hypothetical protein